MEFLISIQQRDEWQLIAVAPTDEGLHHLTVEDNLPPRQSAYSGADLRQSLELRAVPAGIGSFNIRHSAVHTSTEVLGDGGPEHVDAYARTVLAVPRSERWQEAVSTALLGTWCDPLLDTGRRLPMQAES
ncbi:hypothetical protein [Streptomyces mirabilis]|uniref:hypothetical protein n=1 Tax=Streptomyces mirabilis TaxID=68239 RepID=UPI00367E1FB1